MDKLKIVSGNELKGELKISSAKNAILPILCACILIDGEVEIKDFPDFLDCDTMIKILKNFNTKVDLKSQGIKLNLTNLKYGIVCQGSSIIHEIDEADIIDVDENLF